MKKAALKPTLGIFLPQKTKYTDKAERREAIRELDWLAEELCTGVVGFQLSCCGWSLCLL